MDNSGASQYQSKKSSSTTKPGSVSDSICEEIADGTATDAGELTGLEIFPLSRGAGLLQTTLAKITNYVLGVALAFSGSGTHARARTVLSKLADVDINPKDYGAAGDGCTDDTQAMQDAINYAASRGGATILCPHGTYRLSNLIIYSGVTIRSSSTMYQATFNGFSNVTFQQSGEGFVIDSPDSLISGVGIHGINFRGLGACTSGGAVRLRNCKWSKISSCSADNFADQGFVHLAGFSVTFEDILTTNVLLDRDRAAVSGCIESYGTDNFFYRCELNPSLGAIHDSTKMFICGFVLGGANSFCHDVVGEFAERGIYVMPVNGTGHRMSLVRGDSNWGWGIYNDGSAQWMGCFAYHNSNGSPGIYSGFYSSSSSNGNKYMGCRSDGVIGGGLIKYGFEDPSAYTDPNAKNDYFGCTSIYNSLGIFAVNSTSGAGVSFSSKSTSPVNGSTTPSVAGVTVVNLAAYTTATTILTFANPVGGQTIRVKGSSLVTLANGSGIFTPTGAAFPLADHTMYPLTFIAGYWYVG